MITTYYLLSYKINLKKSAFTCQTKKVIGKNHLKEDIHLYIVYIGIYYIPVLISLTNLPSLKDRFAQRTIVKNVENLTTHMNHKLVSTL